MENTWHFLEIEKIYEKLNTTFDGLKNSEARKRLSKYGPNELAPHKKKNILLLFLSQFKSPLIYILLLAAVVTFLLEHTVDTWVILGVVFFNAFFGLFHEIKAERAMEALSKLMALKTKVKRDGVLADLPSIELVPGDIVELTAGGKVPADLRIIEENNLKVDEAPLTGESVPQEKKQTLLQEETALGDRTNMLYGGTLIISGNALGIVIATGSFSEFGKIAKEVAQIEETKTPLQHRLAKFSQYLLIVVLIAVFIIFIDGIIKQLDFFQMFLVSLSAAISAIPEGLPAVITVTLANGAFRMAKRKAIVRKLMAVETLGSVTVIASDKTGTLTHNQMTVEKIYSYSEEQSYKVSGSGYEPKGEIEPRPSNKLSQFLTYSVLCNDAEIFEKNREWGVSGDPTEGALIVSASKAGVSQEEINKKYPRLDEIPFETEKGFKATLNKLSDGQNLIVVQGKTEKILEMANLKSKEKQKITAKMEEFAQEALRVIAVATKEVDKEIQELSGKELSGLTFLGLLGMMDPPRKESFEAVKICQESGIRPIMITGDYSLTAQSVAQSLGIIQKKEDGVISGEELGKLDGETFKKVLNEYSVFARILPEMKLKIVEGLQKENQVVAVTGDGINDAPALKKADIGVAMGEDGTDASKEVADLVLADNNFATIVAAIEEGRTIFQNIKRVIFYLVSTSVGELMIIFTAILLLPAPYNLPLLPVQILWLNLVTDGTAGLSLALEPTHKGVIKFPPRSPKENIINRLIFWRIILVAAIMLIGTFLLYQYEINAGADISRARTIAFVTMVVFQVLNVLNCRSLKESIFKMPFFSNKYVLGSMLLSFILSLSTVYSPTMRTLFHTTILYFADWVKIILVSLSIIVVVEVEKYIRRKTNAKY